MIVFLKMDNIHEHSIISEHVCILICYQVARLPCKKQLSSMPLGDKLPVTTILGASKQLLFALCLISLIPMAFPG